MASSLLGRTKCVLEFRILLKGGILQRVVPFQGHKVKREFPSHILNLLRYDTGNPSKFQQKSRKLNKPTVY